MKKDILNKITRSLGKTGLKIKKHSPEILVVGGIIGGVTAAVMACKATAKAHTIAEEHAEQMDIIHKSVEHGETVNAENEIVTYTEDDAKKDTTIAYAHTAVKYVKLYGPSVVLGGASVVSILAGHNIMKKRNAALAVAYAGIDKSFKEYRERVVDRFGKDIDHELKYNVKAKNFERTVVDEETGEEKTVNETVEVADSNSDFGPYTKCFDETCLEWKRDADYNMMYLRGQQNWANERLKREGFIVLNDIYESLGIPKTKEGQIIGWVYDENNPNLANHIDFGIFNINRESNRLFVNGYEKSIWLDFNCDGNVMDLI